VLSVTVCVGEWSGRWWSSVGYIQWRPWASSLVNRQRRSRVGRWLLQWSHSTAEPSAGTRTCHWQDKLSRQVVARTIIIQWTNVTTVCCTQQQWVVVVWRHLAIQCSLSDWLITDTLPLTITICLLVHAATSQRPPLRCHMFCNPWKTIPSVKICPVVKFMLAAAAATHGEIYAWCPISFFPVKNYSLWNLCLVSHMFLPVTNYPRENYAWCPICFFLWKTIPREIYAWCPICFFPWKTILVKFMLGVPYVSSREKLFPVKFMLGVPYVSSREKLFLVKFMLGVPYVSSREKLFPVKFMLGVPYVSSCEKLFHVKFMLGVPYVSSHEKLSSWNLCLVSHMFLPVKNYSPW